MQDNMHKIFLFLSLTIAGAFLLFGGGLLINIAQVKLKFIPFVLIIWGVAQFYVLYLHKWALIVSLLSNTVMFVMLAEVTRRSFLDRGYWEAGVFSIWAITHLCVGFYPVYLKSKFKV